LAGSRFDRARGLHSSGTQSESIAKQDGESSSTKELNEFSVSEAIGSCCPCCQELIVLGAGPLTINGTLFIS
jgi:hypothetical protein